MKAKKLSLILGLIIFFWGFLVWSNTLPNGFVWDDEEQIVYNPYIRSFKHLKTIFTGSTFGAGGGGLRGWYYKPLMSLAYMANYALWGLNPAGFHLFQILLHLVNAILAFLIFQHFLNLSGKGDNQLWSFFGALIFAIHPVNVESVAYLASLQEGLYAFFILASFLILLKFKQFVFSFLMFFFGLLAKESAVVAAPLIFLYFWLFESKEKAWYWLKGAAVALSAYVYLRLEVGQLPLWGHKLRVPNPINLASFKQRLLTVPFELFSYLRLIFFPKDLFINQHQIVERVSDIRFWASLPAVVVFFVLLVWLLWRFGNRVSWFFMAWFLGSLTLVLNIVPLDMTIAERWLYFPLIGFLGLMIQLFSRFKAERFLLPLFLLTLVLSARTFVRQFDWRHGLRLYGGDIVYQPDDFILSLSLGAELARAGQLKEAKPYFERVIRLSPKRGEAYNNLGAVYEKEGELEKARELYQQAITKADYYLAYENLGNLMLRTEPPLNTINFLKKALAKRPDNDRLWQLLGIAYYQSSQKEKAVAAASQAVKIAPTSTNQEVLQAILQGKKIEFSN